MKSTLVDRVDMPENSREFDQQDRDEVKSVEIVTTAAAHITNAPYDYPATEEISSPSPDQVTGREERPSCTSSCRRTMKEGHRLVSSLDITFSKVSPSVDTVARDSFAKTNTGDEEGDTHLCSTLTGSVTSLGRTAGWTGTRGHLTDSTTIKDHNAVAHVYEAPSHGKSVVETGMEEIMKDVATVQSVSPQ